MMIEEIQKKDVFSGLVVCPNCSKDELREYILERGECSWCVNKNEIDRKTNHSEMLITIGAIVDLMEQAALEGSSVPSYKVLFWGVEILRAVLNNKAV